MTRLPWRISTLPDKTALPLRVYSTLSPSIVAFEFLGSGAGSASTTGFAGVATPEGGGHDVSSACANGNATSNVSPRPTRPAVVEVTRTIPRTILITNAQ